MKVDRPPQRPPGFTYQRVSGQSSQELYADSVPLRRLAERFGTPLYVYSASTIRERFRRFEQAFRGCEHTICYSVKANSNLSVLRLLAGMGAGFDIVSGGELERVLAAGRKSANKVVFSGVGKLASEIDSAIGAGILMFNVESAGELEVLAARAAHFRTPVRFAVRVNPNVAAKTHPHISTGLHQHKFGIPWHDAPALYRRGTEEKYLNPAGVSVHIGSQITDIGAFGEAMERVASLVLSLRQEGLEIRYVDAGGGLGISYEAAGKSEARGHMKPYARAVLRPLRGLGVHLLLEPGRSIIGPAGVLLTRVIYRKRNNGKHFAVVDAAMNDLLRPALYGAYHEIVPAVRNRDGALKEKIDVVGPVCETGDFFARDREIPNLEEGDLLAVLDTGAYGMSLASN